MRSIPVEQARMAQERRALQPLWLLPPVAAGLYPLTLVGFHAAVTAILAGGGALHWASAATGLALAFAVPLLALWVFTRLMRVAAPTRAELLARRVALCAVTSPPLFVLVGVMCFVVGAPGFDVWLLGLFWGGLALAIVRADRQRLAAPPRPLLHARWRVLHGAVALGFIVLFLSLHFSNHLAALASTGTHAAVMEVLRVFYRAPVVEPVLLGAAVFLVCTGLAMAWRWTERPTEAFRAFQVGTGVYLSVAVTSHLQAVFWFARMHMDIPTDWGFAIGAPTGLIRDAWNIRLLPYYLLAVAGVVAHAFAGLRIVLLGHGTERRLADALVVWGTVFGLALAVLISLAMVGLRLNFSGA
ncbi:hypothetical protein [Pseudorhodoferax sp.]|uniref:hypothetical protein n=1 Tax=Pseudorhodoferax sp. TaxID=1993553 RepID=UPI002DD6687A|nr:hypothetical protein [Pseudorhodoferax sp.]